MEKHLAVKITLRRINLQRNVVKRSMTASTTDSAATIPSGRRWLKWDALKRSSKRWVSLQVKTTLTTPIKKRLTSTAKIGGFTQMWRTSIRYQQGTNLISKRRCRQCTASSKRRTKRNKPHGRTIPPLRLGDGMQAGGSLILSTRLKNGTTTDSTGQPVPWVSISICEKSLNMQRIQNFCRKKKYDSIHDRFIRDKTFRKAMIEVGRSEKIIKEMDQLASENHTHVATRAEIDVYRGNWWIHSNVVNFDTMPTRHQPDFKKALSTMYRLKQAEDEKQYAKWSQSSSSSSWQWQTNWWESDLWALTTKMVWPLIERGHPLLCG